MIHWYPSRKISLIRNDLLFSHLVDFLLLTKVWLSSINFSDHCLNPLCSPKTCHPFQTTAFNSSSPKTMVPLFRPLATTTCCHRPWSLFSDHLLQWLALTDHGLLFSDQLLQPLVLTDHGLLFSDHLLQPLVLTKDHLFFWEHSLKPYALYMPNTINKPLTKSYPSF